MSADGLDTRRLAAPLAYRLGDGADTEALAVAFVAVWREVDAALRPVIGARGVAALFHRSVHLASAGHPWLAGARQGSQVEPDLGAVSDLLRRQHTDTALAGADEFLATFHVLLATLIGPSLTERLLRSAWGPPATPSPLPHPTP